VLRCSFLEIYNEVLTDLLNPESTHLQIREDVKLGIYVEHLSEHTVSSRESCMHSHPSRQRWLDDGTTMRLSLNLRSA